MNFRFALPAGLRWRSTLAGGTVWVILVVSLLVVVSRQLDDGFDAVETREVAEAQARLRDLLAKRLQQIEWKARDWAEWDAADSWLRTGEGTFARENLNDSALAILEEEVMAYTDASDRLVAALAFDRKARRATEVDTTCLVRALGALSGEEPIGILECGGGLLMAASHDVRNSMGEGEPSGRFLVGHSLDSAEAKSIAATFGGPVTVRMGRLDSARCLLEEDSLEIHLPVPMVSGPAVGFLVAKLSRPVKGVADRTRKVLLATIFLLAISGTILFLVVLEWLVVRRIGKLSGAVVAFRDSPSPSEIKFGDGQSDEIGELGEAVDTLVERLGRALQGAEDAARTKSTFLASVTHDLRTPLNGMIGLSDFLLKSKLDRSQREALELLRGASENLLAMINDVLEFSRNESVDPLLQIEEVETEDAFHRPLRLLAPIAHHQGIDLLLDLEPDLPSRIRVDAGRLRQVLHNLIGNAVKFTSVGEVVLRVRRLRHEEEATRLQVEVSDTGPGIPADALESIFKPFFQSSPEIGNRWGGTGLGLAIAKEMVQAMGGSLSVRSQVGVGSVFIFEIDVSVAPDARRLVPLRISGGIRGGVGIAVRSRSLRAMLSDLLKRLGLEPVDGGQVWEETKVDGRDIVALLTDEADRQPGRKSDFPCIRLLRSDHLGDAEVCGEVKRCSILRSPVCPSQIVEALDIALHVRVVVVVDTVNAFLGTLVTGALQPRGHRVVAMEDSLRERTLSPEVCLVDGENPDFRARWVETGKTFPLATRIQLGGDRLSGAVEYLERPFSSEQLWLLVESVAVSSSGEEWLQRR